MPAKFQPFGSTQIGIGNDGIPLRDEIELEMILNDTASQ